jgi:hypothetical protein
MPLRKISNRALIGIIFTLTTITLSAVAAVSTANYLQFFPAVQQVQLELSSFQWNDTNGSLNATAIFAVWTTGSYQGLNLQSLQTGVDIKLPNQTLTQGQLLSPAQAPLRQGAKINVTLPFTGVLSTGQQVAKFPRQDVQFTFAVTIVLSTFLDKVNRFEAIYNCQSSGGPGNCVETGILISSSSGGPIVGGGGI